MDSHHSLCSSQYTAYPYVLCPYQSSIPLSHFQGPGALDFFDTYPTQLAAAKANLSKAIADIDFAQKEFARRQELLQAEVLSQQRFDQAKNRLEVARAAVAREQQAVASAEANLRQIQLAEDALKVQKQQLAVETERLNQMRIVLDKYTIRSPCDCTVQTRLIRAGEYVTPGVGVATLLDPLDKYVRIYIPVPDLGKVRVGDRVRLEPDAMPGELFPGEISFIEDIAQFTPKNIEVRSDRITQVFATKVRILDHVERLKPGMEGTVFLDGQTPSPTTTATPTSTSSS